MKMPSLEQTVRSAFEKNAWPMDRGGIVAAVSGGPDSMALAHVLHKMDLLGGIAHVNYALRAASMAETQAVRDFANYLQVPLFFHQARLEEGECRSVQLWARDVRYGFFEEILQQNGFLACALGHHADDQVETILFRLLRSRSLHPLSGIPVARGGFIRPILSVSKQEILDYCREWKLPFSEDESNLESKYIRNQIRNEVLPVLREVNPRIRERLLESSDDLKLRDAWLSKKMQGLALQCSKFSADGHFLNTTRLLKLDPDLTLPMFMGWWLDEVLGLEGNEIRTVLEGLSASPGAKWLLKGGVLKKEINGWTWVPATAQPLTRGGLRPDIIYVFESIEPQKHSGGGWRIEGGSCSRQEWLDAAGNGGGDVYMDAEKLLFPLCIRKWGSGDKIKPLGLKGSKLVKDLIQEEQKRGVLDSPEQLVVVDAGGSVVYVSGCRIAEPVRVLPQTRIVFRLNVQPAV